MDTDPAPHGGQGDDGGSPVRELRRGYHDRIAELREHTLVMLGEAGGAVLDATRALIDQDCDAGERLAAELGTLGVRLIAADSEVLALLALQAPVARDLRVILASRDVAQTTALCIGLCQTLATRIACSRDVLSAELRQLILDTGSATAALLKQAHGAWATLDEAQARAVLSGAAGARSAQSELFTALLRLENVPVETGLNLGTATRVYGRLADHAEEIAERVLFAVVGETPSFNRNVP